MLEVFSDRISKGLVILCVWFGFVGHAMAAEKINVNTDGEGIAVNGYDLVSFFTDGEPQKGDRQYTVTLDGAIYHFASLANRQTFVKDPQKYLPAYGGFCSYGVVLGKKFEVSPDAWRIVDGTLFLQLDKGTRLIWEENRMKNIEIGNRVWPSIENVPPKDL